MTTRTVTLPSTLTGTIYVAFRHHDVTDQFVVDVDNVTVTSTSLRNDEFFASNFSVTPNPASDVITIATKNNIPVESVQVLDMNGRVIKEMNATFEDATTMNISEINSGVYFVKVKSQIVVGTTKVVKK